ncbi:MAG: universal stress protein [Pyrinomonadaceae bacterium]|nr:universal stress protein [Pyrinomonadaceae bacterium]
MNDKFKVLIAYDGSDFADAALDDLKNAGLPESSEILVFSVAEIWLPPYENIDEVEFVNDQLKEKFHANLKVLDFARQSASAAALRVRNVNPAWNVSSDATDGTATWEILNRAESFGADLIIVGSQGKQGMDRILIGSVAQKIVNDANCSVRVARGSVAVDDAVTRIIVGYDGSAGADQAVEMIASRNWSKGTEVLLVVVEDTGLLSRLFDSGAENVEGIAAAAVEELRSRNLEANIAIREGNPKNILLEEANKIGADCIFVGAAKFDDTVSRYLLGSVSSAVVTRADCSVEVVRSQRD